MGATGHRSMLDKQNYDSSENNELKYKRAGWDWENPYGTKKNHWNLNLNINYEIALYALAHNF